MPRIYHRDVVTIGEAPRAPEPVRTVVVVDEGIHPVASLEEVPVAELEAAAIASRTTTEDLAAAARDALGAPIESGKPFTSLAVRRPRKDPS